MSDVNPHRILSFAGKKDGIISSFFDLLRQMSPGVGVTPPPVRGDLPTTMKRPENSAPEPVRIPEQNPIKLSGASGSIPGLFTIYEKNECVLFRQSDHFDNFFKTCPFGDFQCKSLIAIVVANICLLINTAKKPHFHCQGVLHVGFEYLKGNDGRTQKFVNNIQNFCRLRNMNSAFRIND